MSPTVFRFEGYRFFFFSKEERRPHVHVSCADGEAKFWLDPTVELVKSCGLSQAQIGEMRKIVEERNDGSSVLGAVTSETEVTNIDRFGLWILVKEKEYFLSYEEYPWFKNAAVNQILNVQFLHEDHLHWPDLDVDLCLESLEQPENYPLIYK